MATAEELLTPSTRSSPTGSAAGCCTTIVEDEVLDGRHRHDRRPPPGQLRLLLLPRAGDRTRGCKAAVTRRRRPLRHPVLLLPGLRLRAALPRGRGDPAGLFGRPTIVTPSTTLGHLAAMPTLVGSRDVLLLDHQVHASVQTAAKLAQAAGRAGRADPAQRPAHPGAAAGRLPAHPPPGLVRRRRAVLDVRRLPARRRARRARRPAREPLALRRRRARRLLDRPARPRVRPRAPRARDARADRRRRLAEQVVRRGRRAR